MKVSLSEIKKRAFSREVLTINRLPGVHIMHNIVWRKLSIPFVWFFLRVNFSANQVTVLSIIVLFIACGFFVGGNSYFIIACSLLFFGNILDSVDGRIATFTNTKSKYGAFLDDIFGILLPPLTLGAIGIGLYKTGGDLFTRCIFGRVESFRLLTPNFFIFLGFIGAMSWLIRLGLDQSFFIHMYGDSEYWLKEVFSSRKGIAKIIFEAGNFIGSFLIPMLLITSVFNVLSSAFIFYSLMSLIYTLFNIGRYIVKL